MHWTEKSVWDRFDGLHEPGYWPVEEYRKQWQVHGLVHVPGFVTGEALTEMQFEASCLQGVAYRSESYDAKGEFQYSATNVAKDHLAPSGAILGVYHDPAFQKALNDVTGVTWHEYGDPLAGAIIATMEEGDQVGWHLDRTGITLSIILHRPNAGGVFQWKHREAQDDTTAFSVSAGVGDLVFFADTEFIHRVTPIEGKGARRAVLMNYCAIPGQIHLKAEAAKSIYGRSTALHEISNGTWLKGAGE